MAYITLNKSQYESQMYIMGLKSEANLASEGRLCWFQLYVSL